MAGWVQNLRPLVYKTCNRYTMGCPPVRGDNPRALASGLSYVQVNIYSITISITYISVDLAHQVIFHAKVGKGGIKVYPLHLCGFPGYKPFPPGWFKTCVLVL